MMNSLPLCVVLPILVSVLNISAARVHYVRSNGSSPQSCSNHPCLTLDQYADETSLYFTTGATFVFLAGNHSLAIKLNLTNISNITLRGQENDSDISILFRNGVSVQCTNITGINIEDLTFVLGSNNMKSSLAALIFINSNSVYFSKLTFLGSGDLNKVLYGAVLSIYSNITTVSCTFKDNTANFGAAMYAKAGSSIILDGNNSFIGNKAAKAGGGILATHSSITLKGTLRNLFENNTASIYGGAISILHSHLLISGSATFTSNHASNGGAVSLGFSNTTFNGEPIQFVHNTADLLGGAIVNYNSTFVSETCQMHFFANGHAKLGAGIYSRNGQKLKLSCAAFINNTVQRDGCGGAMFITNEKAAVFHNLTLTGNTHSSFCIDHSNVTIRGTSTFNKNRAEKGGGIYSSHSLISFTGHTLIEENEADKGGFMVAFFSDISFSGVTVVQSNIAGENGGAFYAIETDIKLKGSVNFSSNKAATLGGVMCLTSASTLTLLPHTNLTTSHNYASGYGGTIFHEDTPTQHQCHFVLNESSKDYIPPCFMKLRDITLTYMPFHINSYNDSAGKDGGFLYGGMLDRCQMNIKFSPIDVLGTLVPYGFLMTNITHIEALDNRTTKLTSQPFQLCFCENETQYDCSGVHKIDLIRGQKFAISILALAQGDTITSSLVTTIVNSTARLKVDRTVLPATCTSFSYNFYSTKNREELVLYPNGPCRDTGLAAAIVKVTFLPCPNAFTRHHDQCVCEERLQEYDVDCIIDDHIYIKRRAAKGFWMNSSIVDGTYRGLILCKTCPVEYCTKKAVNITLDDLDIQCDVNRDGILCGACAANYSLTLGGSQCKVCSNIYLTLLLPFAAAGIALVVMLTFLRLTVATGMINSIILYANIIQANKTLFLPINTTNVLTVFIAWLNLDLGFQTCFYHGLDAYAVTWLQFAFPLYIWILIGLIVLTSRCSLTVSKLIGSNPIAVLATLILMSYNKILKIIIEVYAFVHLDYPDNKTVTVWLKDANVPYLKSKHLLLTMVTSLVLVFLFLPYTFLLLGHKLYYFSDRKYFHWLNRLKPLLDSYYAPYKINTRYWTGFLLLVRCALYIVFSFNSLGDTTKSFLAIIITFTTVGIASGYLASGRIYTDFYTNIIEASIYLNLVLLSAASLANANSSALVFTLVGKVFVTMIAIILYHFYLNYSALWWKLKTQLFALIENLKTTTVDRQPLLRTNQASASLHGSNKIVTRTYVGLREPVKEYN